MSGTDKLFEFKLGKNHPRPSAIRDTCAVSLGQILKSQ